MRLLQGALDTPLDSPFSATLSIHGLHFTVYTPLNRGNFGAMTNLRKIPISVSIGPRPMSKQRWVFVILATISLSGLDVSHSQPLSAPCQPLRIVFDSSSKTCLELIQKENCLVPLMINEAPWSVCLLRAFGLAVVEDCSWLFVYQGHK